MSKQKKHLSLRMMACKLGGHVNVRVERHGDDDVPACDITIAGLMLKASEFNLLVDDDAYDALWCADDDGKPNVEEPLFKRFKPLQLKDKYAECTAEFVLGLEEAEIALKDITIARIRFEPQVGGLVQTSVQLQCTPPAEDMAKLIAFLNSDTCTVKLTFGKKAEADDQQKDLSLEVIDGGAGDGEQPPATH
jgi:hypothetical protein